MPDKEPRGTDLRRFVGRVFVGTQYDPTLSLIYTQSTRALDIHGRERYETPEDDPTSKLNPGQILRRTQLLFQDPIYLERVRPLVEMQGTGLQLPEDQLREVWISVWDRTHDYMSARDPAGLLAQARRQARNKRGPNTRE